MWRSILMIVFSIYLNAENINIGTGGLSGVYYPTGNNICKIVHSTYEDINCTVVPTNGSVYNINGIRNKKFQFALAQSDTIFYAYNGIGTFHKKAYKDIRTVMTIYPEFFTFIVNKSAHIYKMLDIEGKTINLGRKGSGARETIKMLFKEARPLKVKNLKKYSEFSDDKSIELLRSGKIDGFFTIIGHPNKKIRELSQEADIDIVDVSPKTCLAIKQVLIKNPFLTLATIPKGTYQNINHDVKSFGVKATLITSKNTDYKLVKKVISAIVDNFEEFKKMHPAYKNVRKRDIIKGLGAPLHPAARDYLKEHNFI